MEKLIELLNECTNGRFKSEDDLRLYIEMRGYCRKFIKRLIENDKIDKKKLTTLGTDDMRECYLEDEILLMILIIQDKPLDFLSSILK